MKKILMLNFFIISLFCVITYADSWNFSDVDTNHWAYNTIKYINKLGVINGYPDGSFKPNGLMTRAEFSKVLFNAMSLKKSYTNVINYEDVPLNHWAYEYIKSTSKFIDGYSGDGTIVYHPDEPIKRVDVARAIVKSIGWNNKEYDKDTLKRYSDIALLPKDDQDCIAIAYENNIMRGYNDGCFKPQSNITRAEIAKTISNVYLRSSLIKYEEKGINTYTWIYSGDKKIYPKSGDAIEYKVDDDGKIFTLDGRSFDELVIEIEKSKKISSGDSSGDIKNNSGDKNLKTESGEKSVSNKDNSEEKKKDEKTIPISSSSMTKDVSLSITLHDEKLDDGKTYVVYTDDKISAKILNASSGKNYIYYSYSYGKDTKINKVDSSSINIEVPENIGANKFKLTTWGVSIKNGKSYITDTLIIYFNCTGRKSLTIDEITAIEEEKFIKETGLILDDGKLSFIVVFAGYTLKNEETCNSRHKQSIIIRSKPVDSVQEIRYRWDNDQFMVINGTTATIEIPDNFEKGTTHKFTVMVVGKDGTVSKFGKYNFNIL